MAQPEPSKQIVRFGVFEVDPAAGELRRDGLRVKIQEKPFQVLCQLLERPGEVVTREELQERLWPDVNVDIEHSLSTAIKKLRDALEDTAENPRFVETKPLRGYRFIAPVDREGERAPATPPEGPTKPEADESGTQIQEATVVGVCVIRVVGALSAGEKARAFNGLANRRIEEGRRLFVLSLRGLSFVDAEGLEAILRVWDRLHQQVGKVAFVTTDKLRDPLVVVRPEVAGQFYLSAETAVASLLGVPAEQVPTVVFRTVFVGSANTSDKRPLPIGGPFSRTARHSQVIGSLQLVYAVPFACNAVVAPGLPESVLSLLLLALGVGAAWAAGRGDIQGIRTFDRWLRGYCVLDFLAAGILVVVAVRLDVLVAGLLLLPVLFYLPFYQRRVAREAQSALKALILQQGIG